MSYGETCVISHLSAPPPPPEHEGSRADHISGLAQFLLSRAGAMFGAREDGEEAARRRRERRLPALVAEARAAERRDGPVRVQAPLLKRTEEKQGRGGRASRTSTKRHGDRSPILPSRVGASPAVPGHPVWLSRGGRSWG